MREDNLVTFYRLPVRNRVLVFNFMEPSTLSHKFCGMLLQESSPLSISFITRISQISQGQCGIKKYMSDEIFVNFFKR